METLKRVKIPSFLKEKLIGHYDEHYQMYMVVMTWKRGQSASGYVWYYEKIVHYVNTTIEPLTRNLEHKFKTKSKTFKL